MLKRLESALRWIAILSCGLLTLFTVTTIVTRVVHIPFYVANELNGSLMIVLVFLALPYVTRKRQHLWVEFFWGYYPVAFRRVMTIVIDVMVFGYLLLLSYLCARLAIDSGISGTRAQGLWRVPLVYAQTCMAVGLAITAITQLAITLVDLSHRDS